MDTLDEFHNLGAQDAILDDDNHPLAQLVRAHTTVRIVAVLQAGIFESIKETVNAKASVDRKIPDVETKISTDIARDFVNRHYTIGDFVAYCEGANSVQNLNEIAKRVFEFEPKDKALELLYNKHLSKLFSYANFTGLVTLSDHITALKALFRTRNLICHEFATGLQIDSYDLLKQYVAAVRITELFLHEAVEVLISVNAQKSAAMNQPVNNP